MSKPLNDETSEDQTITSGISLKNVNALIGVMTDVVRELQEVNLLNRRNLILLGLNKFSLLLKKDVVIDDLAPYILDFYAKIRSEIIDGDDDKWMTNPNLILWYGQDIPEVKAGNFKLMISASYNKALEIKERHVDKLTGEEEIDAKMKEDDLMYYPDELTYYTLSIIAEAIKINKEDYQEDLPIIKDYISALGEEIGIIPDDVRNKNGSGLNDIIQSVAKAADQSGFKMGENGPNISEALNGINGGQLNHVLDNFFKDDEIKNSMTQVFNKVNNQPKGGEPSNVGDVFGDIFNTMMPALQKAMSGMNPDGPPPNGVNDEVSNNPEDFEGMKSSFQDMANAAQKMVGSMPKPKSNQEDQPSHQE